MPARIRLFTLVGLNLFLAANAVAGALWVVPTLPGDWLAGTPFADYTIPAVALGVVVGLGALSAAILLIVRAQAGAFTSGVVGAGMMIFELVETSVVGGDIWLHLLGLAPVGKGLPATDVTGIPAPLGIPLPLWQQPLFFLLGLAILVLAGSLWRTSHGGDHQTQTGPGEQAVAQYV